jgi:hypothetical protein
MTQAANLGALGTNAGTTGILPIAGGGTAGTNGVTGFKNRIINGAMVIDQRNAGASVTPNTSTNVFPVDRFQVGASQNSKLTAQQNAGSVTPPAGFTYYTGLTSSSAYSVISTDYFWVGQFIEGYNIADLGWGTANAKTITISFWVRSSLTGTFGGAISNSAYDRSYPFTYTISSANTWTSISVTIAGDTSGTWLTTNGIGMRVFFGLGVGTTYSGTSGSWAGALYISATGATSVVGTNGATFYITGVQLEVGTAATNFDVRSYGTELSLCQRYFVRYGGTSNYEYAANVSILPVNTVSAYGPISFPVAMRTTPSVSGATLRLVDEGSGYPISSIASSGAQYGSPYALELYIVSSGLTAYRTHFIQANNSTSAYLYINAEL